MAAYSGFPVHTIILYGVYVRVRIVTHGIAWRHNYMIIAIITSPINSMLLQTGSLSSLSFLIVHVVYL